MKLGIKYCMIILLTILLHHSIAGAMDLSCAPTFSAIERCNFSQAPTAGQAVRNIYNHFPAKALCLDHVDTTQVPGNKCILLVANHLWIEWLADSLSRSIALPPAFDIQSDPLTYYIFGLRKILI